MNQRAHELLEEALALPDEDRIQMAEALLSSVTPPDELPFDPEWLLEAKRRAARIDSGKTKLSSWTEVRDRGRRKLGGHPGG